MKKYKLLYGLLASALCAVAFAACNSAQKCDAAKQNSQPAATAPTAAPAQQNKPAVEAKPAAKPAQSAPADTTKNAAHLKARPTSDKNKQAIVYQILLPIFTHEGTLDKARQMLPHIKNTGVNIVYLCPVVQIDDDTDLAFWSKRQKASKTGNPKNPYRLKDYFKIEPDYGTDADLKNFVDDAHKLGLRVILDLVYYHCGPKATLIDEDKNLVVCDANGNVKLGRWSFPELNFDNPKLREKMWSNMEYFVKKFDIDGYRTDVEGSVPADFWAEGYKRIIKIKPDLFMLAESSRADSQVDAYDASYGFRWHNAVADAFRGKKDATAIRQIWQKDFDTYAQGSRLIRDMDNHDTASDICVSAGARFEKLFTSRGMDAVLVLNYTIDGVPMIFSGNEFADDTKISMFSSPQHGRYFVGWENLSTPRGQERMALLKKLAGLRTSHKALWDGKTQWLKNSDEKVVLSFKRSFGDEEIVVLINTKNSDATAYVDIDTKGFEVLLKYGVETDLKDGKTLAKFLPFGYAVLSKKF